MGICDLPLNNMIYTGLKGQNTQELREKGVPCLFSKGKVQKEEKQKEQVNVLESSD